MSHLGDVFRKKLGFGENLRSNLGIPGAGRMWLCHILEVLLVTLNVLLSRWAKWATTVEEKIMIIYHWQSGLCGDNLPFPGILPDKYFNTADAKKKPTTICPKNVQIPCFSSALQFWMYLSQNKWVNLGQNLHKCFMKTRRHNVSYIKTPNITFRQLRKTAVRKKILGQWPLTWSVLQGLIFWHFTLGKSF